MVLSVIDTHIHSWDLQRNAYDWLEKEPPILNRSYTLEELAPQALATGITQGLLVQAANHTEDTDFMLENARFNDWISGVVGWLPLQHPDETEKMLTGKYRNNHWFKGVRHLIHNETDERWLLQEEVLESLQILARHGIPYDLVGISTGHLETALTVAGKIPGLKMVFDHLNRPPILTGEKFGRWGELMKQASQHEAFYCKISGLGTASGNHSGWSKEDIKPYIVQVLEWFGTNRIFCGGDWPVCLLAGSYAKTWQAYREILGEELDEADEQKILFHNAVDFYHL